MWPGERSSGRVSTATCRSISFAAAGKTIRTYEGTAATEEVIVSGNQIFALVSTGARRLTEYAPGLNVGDQQRVTRTFRWNEIPREVSGRRGRNRQGDVASQE